MRSARVGTTVSVDLRLTIIEKSAQARRPLRPLRPRHPAAGMLRVLVVDDHKPNLMPLRQQLDYLGQRVVAADSAKPPSALWHEHAFDVVITDCTCPVSTATNWRAAYAPPRPRPVTDVRGAFCSASRLRRRWTKRSCRAAGMDDCLFGRSAWRLAATLERSRGTGRAPHAPPPQAAAPATHDATPAAFSAESILALTQNDEELIRQLLEEVIRTNRADVDQLQKLHQQADWPKVSDMAHRLAGGARVVDAKAMIDTCAGAGEKRKARAGPSPEIDGMVRTLAAQSAALETQLRAWLEQRPHQGQP